MTAFPAIEAYRAELRALDYRRLSDAELAEARRRLAEMHHSNAIEGVHPTPEQAAFWSMVLEERVPRDVLTRYSRRFLHERLLDSDAVGRHAPAA